MDDLHHPPTFPGPGPGPGLARLMPPPPLFLLQPLLARVVRRVATLHPALFDRLGLHARDRYLLDVGGLPFLLLLVPDPAAPRLQALRRVGPAPAHEARIAGRFLDLLGLIDGGADGDALFFSRDLDISGDTEAVVCLRNALDDVEGSIAEDVAAMFGPPGRLALAGLRRTQARAAAR